MEPELVMDEYLNLSKDLEFEESVSLYRPSVEPELVMDEYLNLSKDLEFKIYRQEHLCSCVCVEEKVLCHMSSCRRDAGITYVKKEKPISNSQFVH